LESISPSLSNLNINGNLTVVHSELKMNEAELRARRVFEKEGQTIEDTREMAGQAPYIINAGLGYDNPKIGLDAGFSTMLRAAHYSLLAVVYFRMYMPSPFIA
jgi:hypothetical protein